MPSQSASPFNERPARIFLVSVDGQPSTIDVKEPAAEVRIAVVDTYWPVLHRLDGEPIVINPERIETISAAPVGVPMETDHVW